jgi:uncharacterized RDD family membrane protein YckC
MVLRDLSTPESAPPQLSKVAYRLPLGPVADRFLALVLDFLILSPIVSFFLATSLKDLKTLQLMNSESEEAVVIWFIFVVSMVAISCGLQACFLYFWQATPGQKFLQLRVISFPPRNDADSLTAGQALTRTLGWWGSALLFGMPFLEVVGHPFRRAFHERMSDTMVVSLKHEHSDMPLPVESRYVGTTLWVFFGFLFVVGMMLMAKAYKAAMLEGFMGNKAVAAVNFCPAVLTEDYKEQKRLDMAIALFVSGQVTDDCLSKEAEKVLWGAVEEEKPLAQVAMALISEEKEVAASYHKKSCEAEPKSEACVISKYLQSKEKNRADILRKAGLALVSSKVLLLTESMQSAKYADAAGLISELQSSTPLREYLDRSLVKAAWAVSQPATEKGKGRVPASAADNSVMNQFKTRFGIK